MSRGVSLLLSEGKFCPDFFFFFFQDTEFVILTDCGKIWHVLLIFFSKATCSLSET